MGIGPSPLPATPEPPVADRQASHIAINANSTRISLPIPGWLRVPETKAPNHG